MTAPLPSFSTYTTEQVAELVQPAREIPRLIEARAAIEHMRDSQFDFLPDDAYDRLCDAAMVVAEAIIAAPITCAADVADKFRFAASLIDASADGMLTIEPKAVMGALADLIAERCPSRAP